MKKLYIIAILIISLVFLILFYLGFDKLSDNKKISADLFEQYKNECKIFNAEDGESRIYKNELLDFSFEYPENSLVCEREFENYTEGNTKPGMEITIWSKTKFLNNELSKPELIVHINNSDLALLPDSKILSSKEIEIGNIKTFEKVQESSLCPSKDCPTFTSVNIKYQENDIEIQSWIDSQSIFDSLKFD